MSNYWLNLPVSNVAQALNFYRAIGFEIIEERSNNETIGAFKIGDQTICVFRKDILEGFMGTEVKNISDKPEMIVSFNFSNNASVDALNHSVKTAGGSVLAEPSMKNGYYGMMFTDIDGHYFNVIVM